MFRAVKPGNLVEQFRAIGERLEAVRKPFRDVEHPAIFLTQYDFKVPGKSRRVLAQIDDNIENGPGNTPDQLGFLMAISLKVHPSQGPFPVIIRKRSLFQMGVEAPFSEFAFTPRAGKETSLVRNGI